MIIYAMRHGQTDWNTQSRIQGKTDIPLNETGRMQARAIAESLPDGITVILSSPLKRAIETAEIVNERFGVPIVIEEALIERNFGGYEGQLMSDVDFNALRSWWSDTPTPGGETIREVCDRVFGFASAIEEKYSGQTVLIVTHGHVLCAMDWYWDGLPQRGGQSIPEMENCAVREFVVREG